MAGKAQTKTLFRVPESNETTDHTVTTKKSDLSEIEKYRDFIKKTTGYEPSVSDIFNQAVMFFIARDSVYKKHFNSGHERNRTGKTLVKSSPLPQGAKLFSNDN